MITRIRDWWRTRQFIKLGNAEVDRFNAELSECRQAIVSIADDSIANLNGELESLKARDDFGLDLCRETWRDWHDEGEEIVEASRDAVHQRLYDYLEFARVLEIEAEMQSIIDKAIDECKAYFLLGGADAYAKFATSNGLVPDED